MPEADVLKFDQLLPAAVKPIPGTMNLHQIQFIEPGKISVRDLSCFCNLPLSCSCLGARFISMPGLKTDCNQNEDAICSDQSHNLSSAQSSSTILFTYRSAGSPGCVAASRMRTVPNRQTSSSALEPDEPYEEAIFQKNYTNTRHCTNFCKTIASQACVAHSYFDENKYK